MKKIICFIISSFVIFSSIAVITPATSVYGAKAKKITMKVDSKKKSMSPAAKAVSGKIYVPAKSLSKAIKAKYSYNKKKKLVTIKKGQLTVTYKINKKKATVNGKNKTTSAAKLYNEKPFVMVKFVANTFGYKYSYNKKTKAMTLKTDPKASWILKYHENFNTKFNEPTSWRKDTNPNADDEFHGDDGIYFKQAYKNTFINDMSKFDGYRKSYTYGEDKWLTVELYSRGNPDGSGISGSKFTTVGGKARLTSPEHTDGGIIRSTKKLPDTYRVEVKVSNINFGGKTNGSWGTNGYTNSRESAKPWTNDTASKENGVYFLCITDYMNPKPHNNVFIHHHRKVVMDTDNNTSGWSYIWNPNIRGFEKDGDRYVNLVWLNGEAFGSNDNGNRFVSYTPGGLQTTDSQSRFADKYIDKETYTFTIERTPKYYKMSITGKFVYGGKTTYSYTKPHVDKKTNISTWHFNQNPKELGNYTPNNDKIDYTYDGVTKTLSTWPKNSSYPDFFFFGDPHINYYEGSCDYDDVKLYLPIDSKWK